MHNLHTEANDVQEAVDGINAICKDLGEGFSSLETQDRERLMSANIVDCVEDLKKLEKKLAPNADLIIGW